MAYLMPHDPACDCLGH